MGSVVDPDPVGSDPEFIGQVGSGYGYGKIVSDTCPNILT
jgi:hypothetical protein